MVQAEEGVVEGIGGDPGEFLLDGGEVAVLHQPEDGFGVGDPAVQQLGVGGRIDGAQGELPERGVGAGEEGRPLAGPGLGGARRALSGYARAVLVHAEISMGWCMPAGAANS